MSYTHIKFGKHGAYGTGSESGIALNSLAAESGMFLKKVANGSDNFVGKAGVGEDIIGSSMSEKTYASDNETVAKAKVTYRPKAENDSYIIESTGQVITFSAALVTSNVINMKVNGVAMTAVTFATDNDTTLAAIATQLLTQFSSVLEATIGAARNGTRAINIVPKGANSTVVISDVVVTAGASQATATVAEVVPTTGDFKKYFDITSGQYINANSESTTTGTFLLQNATAKEYQIVNA